MGGERPVDERDRIGSWISQLNSLAEMVAHLRDLVYDYGALEFQFNIGLLYFGPRTWFSR